MKSNQSKFIYFSILVVLVVVCVCELFFLVHLDERTSKVKDEIQRLRGQINALSFFSQRKSSQPKTRLLNRLNEQQHIHASIKSMKEHRLRSLSLKPSVNQSHQGNINNQESVQGLRLTGIALGKTKDTYAWLKQLESDELVCFSEGIHMKKSQGRNIELSFRLFFPYSLTAEAAKY